MTLERVAALPGLRPCLVVTGAAHIDLARSGIAAGGLPATLIVEPVGRNTAPAAIAAALIADPEDVLVILPSDHLVIDGPGFRAAVLDAAAVAAEGGIVTFGVVPTRPETGYGYIEIGPPAGRAHEVAAFKEKPGPAEAAAMAADGRHLWNSGVFVARAGDFLEEAGAHRPDVVTGVEAALPTDRVGDLHLGPEFGEVDPVSIDYAIMEKTGRARVLPIDVGWDDVGSYRSLLAASERDDAGNHLSGQVTISGVTGSLVKATSRRVVVAGLDGVIVVETPDAVLVAPLDRAQEVGDLQQQAEER